MVWFYRLWCEQCKVVHVRLSIPLWSDFIIKKAEVFDGYLKLFQSHYGLILSIVSLCSELLRVLSFNPTMVWFYRANILPILSNLGAFQSHYGLILSEFAIVERGALIQAYNFQSHYGLILSRNGTWQDGAVFSAFNPTMVWFYHNSSLETAAQKYFFQSHYGLILSASIHCS